MKTIIKKLLFLIVALIPTAGFSQQSKEKGFDANNSYWVTVEESLLENNKIKKCDDLLKNSGYLILTFTHLDSNGHNYTMMLPSKSRAWVSESFVSVRKNHGQSGTNILKKSHLKNGKLSVTYISPSGVEQTVEYALHSSGNSRYMVSIIPGNGLLNKTIEAQKKLGKPGILEIRCEGPIINNGSTVGTKSVENAKENLNDNERFLKYIDIE